MLLHYIIEPDLYKYYDTMRASFAELTAQVMTAQDKEAVCRELLKQYTYAVTYPEIRASLVDDAITTKKMFLLCLRATLFWFFVRGGDTVSAPSTPRSLPDYVKEFLPFVENPKSATKLSVEHQRSWCLLQDKSQTPEQIAVLDIYIVGLQAAMFDFSDI